MSEPRVPYGAWVRSEGSSPVFGRAEALSPAGMELTLTGDLDLDRELDMLELQLLVENESEVLALSAEPDGAVKGGSLRVRFVDVDERRRDFLAGLERVPAR